MDKAIVPVKTTPTETEGNYNPKMTAEIRNGVTKSVLSESMRLLKSKKNKIDLRDFETVREVTEAYMQHCNDNLIIPTFEGLCGAFGLGRSWFYEYLRKNPQSETAQYMEQIRSIMADIKEQLALKGVTNPIMTIFLLKNSNLGFVDKSELGMSIKQDVNPYENGDPDEVRKRYLEQMAINDSDI